MTSKVEEYLAQTACPSWPEFERPRWSSGGDAVIWPDGSTAALAGEVALFVEGYASAGPLLPFPWILHLLIGLNRHARTQPPPPGTSPTREAAWCAKFRAAGRPTRNAGALCALLCRRATPAIDPPPPREVILRLNNPALQAALAVAQAGGADADGDDRPGPLDRARFDDQFYRSLDLIASGEIDHFFRHGQFSMEEAGDAVADVVDACRPAREADAGEWVERLPRLEGIAPLMAQMVAALALPRRRKCEDTLPTGGYADVTNRGPLDRVLPGQLVVDPDEFVRRYAAGELLFFEREEPHGRIADEVVLLLDQGVRCWGRVRLILAAAALALGRNAGSARTRWRIAGTSTAGVPLDPAGADRDTLARFWEASDLSADPSASLAALLAAGSEGARRDVVVLSHPRSVAGGAFAEAAGHAGRGDRVFSVAADERGAVDMAEWRRGGSVPVRSFRVAWPEPNLPAPPPPAPDPRSGWTGDVEPIPYPFRLGPAAAQDLFAFDHEGTCLAVAFRDGVVFYWNLDGSGDEVLPRGMLGDSPVTRAFALVGVAGGFVVGGSVAQQARIAVHYDRASRVVRSYPIELGRDENGEWFYFRSLHALVVRGRERTVVVELATGEVRTVEAGEVPPSSLLAYRAARLVQGLTVPPPTLVVVHPDRAFPGPGPTIALDYRTGSIHLDRVTPPWPEFTPMAEGKPSLTGWFIERAQLAGEFLAIQARDRGSMVRSRFLVFRGPAATPVREEMSRTPGEFRLSTDGTLMAMRGSGRTVQVLATASPHRPILVTGRRGPHADLKVAVGPDGLRARVGHRSITVIWGRGPLSWWSSPNARVAPDGSIPVEHDPGPLVELRMQTGPWPLVVSERDARYVGWAASSLIALQDRHNQIALFQRGGGLVAMLLLYRGEVAAWMPDGTRLGPAHLIAGANRNAARAADRIAASLRAASVWHQSMTDFH